MMGNRIFVLFLLGLFSLSFASSLGITPARTTINFEPGLSRDIEFGVINSGGKNMGVLFTVQGELGKYISFPIKEASISSEEGSKTFSYKINLPEKLGPGLHTGEIFILEVPEGGSQAGTQVLATLAVVTQLHIYVPYPGKYANSQMVIYNANQGENVKFVFPVVSAGEFDLTSVRAQVAIFNKLDEQVGIFETDSISVESGTKKEIIYDWKADVPIGEYRATATLIYDEGTINLEEQFSVGSKELELKEINVNGFTLGEIAKLEMLVENKWSEPISGAHIETKIKNSNGDIVSSFESASYDVAALAKQMFVSYWDTAGVRVGTYETEVSINYAGKSSKKNLQFKVEENDLTIIGLGYVISAGEEGGPDTLVIVLVTVIVLLVFVNLLWFFLIRKKLAK